MAKEWVVAPTWAERSRASSRWGVPALVAQVLHLRGIDSPQEASVFVQPRLSGLHSPMLLPGAPHAARRIADAVRKREKIVIYGDYDVDGIAGTAILWQGLTLAQGQVDFYVPHRLEEGYGVNAESIDCLAAQGARVIVTVDCGISSLEAAERAARQGIDLIITDHHRGGQELPKAFAVVHPTLSDGYPDPDLAGAGVAFKLMWAVAQELSLGQRVDSAFRDFLLSAVCLAALGTIADCVPLIGENRIIAAAGLAGLRACSLPGLRALIEASGLANERVNSEAVGFRLAPRLNAAGRMGHARLAVELLTRATGERAAEIAKYLDKQNRQRQRVERTILEEAEQMTLHAGMDRDACRGIVLARGGWHPGVIGIVAARLVERFGRPTVLIALENGQGQGSCRSIPRFAMCDALWACREHLQSFGGHAMAAGFRIDPACVRPFTEAFVQHANQVLTGQDVQLRLRLDGVASLAELTVSAAEWLERLGPFGVGNPRPRFATDWVELAGSPRCVGQQARHLQFQVQEGQTIRKAIGFGLAGHHPTLLDHRRCRLAFEPIINQFNRATNVELRVLDIQYPP